MQSDSPVVRAQAVVSGVEKKSLIHKPLGDDNGN
jgi:hypothetical protein